MWYVWAYFILGYDVQFGAAALSRAIYPARGQNFKGLEKAGQKWIEVVAKTEGQ
jgi:hypothetical protein